MKDCRKFLLHLQLNWCFSRFFLIQLICLYVYIYSCLIFVNNSSAYILLLSILACLIAAHPILIYLHFYLYLRDLPNCFAYLSSQNRYLYIYIISICFLSLASSFAGLTKVLIVVNIAVVLVYE